jgi:DNA-binding NtrC family response regulator
VTPGKKRVLIVDDDPRIVDKLATLLAARYDTRVASNGFDALTEVGKGTDVILLDVRMPGLDGPGFVNELQQHRIQVPVILMSANPNLAETARSLGIRHYLGKPFDIETVEAIIDRL